MHRPISLAGALAIVLLAAPAVRAQDSDDAASLKNKVQRLEQKVAALEAQVAALEPLRKEYEQREAFRKEVEELGDSPGPIESTNQPVAANTALKCGQILQVEQGGQWWAGRILSLLPDGNVKVHYLGWAADWDEVVPRTRLQLDPEAASKAKKAVAAPPAAAAKSPPGPIAPSDIQVTAATVLKVGDAVQVEWGNSWWAGEVLSLTADQTVKIHYAGWGAEWDEVVPRSRLRLPSIKH